MLGDIDSDSIIKAVVTGICGFGAIGYFCWQVFSRIKVDDRRNELDSEQKEDRSSLRRRNGELELEVKTLHKSLWDVISEASSKAALVTILKDQLVDYRRREQELEEEVKLYKAEAHDLHSRMIELTSKSSSSGAIIMKMEQQIIELQRKIKELEYEIKMIEGSFDESEGLVGHYRVILGQAKTYLDGCKNCQNSEALKYLRAELPKYLVKNEHNDPLLLVDYYDDECSR